MLARPRQTVVIYMGRETLLLIANQLIRHGLPASNPIRLTENGTTSREQRVVGTLATIGRQALQINMIGPTLRVVSEVGGLALSGDP
jgi:uroporphyrin-III C-methyltransferase / precorrin-2 dehydrogenase / sirohydrochlorin ferrochelatase